jgi:uncharacterized protein YlzI (FlbEa/FlbD family)
MIELRIVDGGKVHLPHDEITAVETCGRYTLVRCRMGHAYVVQEPIDDILLQVEREKQREADL